VSFIRGGPPAAFFIFGWSLASPVNVGRFLTGYPTAIKTVLRRAGLLPSWSQGKLASPAGLQAATSAPRRNASLCAKFASKFFRINAATSVRKR
jgi:hypothetical protein